MPIRTASLAHQIQKNGARLHLAMLSRVHSQGADQPASELELALLDERRLLKEARAKRQAQAKLPKPKAARLVKEAKPPKAPKAPKAASPAAQAAPGQSAAGPLGQTKQSDRAAKKP